MWYKIIFDLFLKGCEKWKYYYYIFVDFFWFILLILIVKFLDMVVRILFFELSFLSFFWWIILLVLVFCFWISWVRVCFFVVLENVRVVFNIVVIEIIFLGGGIWVFFV